MCVFGVGCGFIGFRCVEAISLPDYHTVLFLFIAHVSLIVIGFVSPLGGGDM